MADKRTRNIQTLDIIRANNMIPSFNKFHHLNKGSNFNRWDLIPRYLAIEEHFGENDFGWEMFRKLRIHQSSEFSDGHGRAGQPADAGRVPHPFFHDHHHVAGQ